MNTLKIDNLSHTDTLSSLTEVSLSRALGSPNQLIMPMLAHLSNRCNDKWFTVIGPQILDKEKLEEFGFCSQNLRLIHTSSNEESLWVMWEALKLGNSAHVVACLTGLNDKSRNNLETAAALGQTQGLVLNFQ